MKRALVHLGIAVVSLPALCGCAGSKSTESRPATTSSGPASLADVVAAVRNGVIRIEAETCEGRSVGTGFLIGRRSIATVEHVVDGATRIELKRGQTTLASATVIGSDSARDLALLRSSRPIDGHQFGLLPRTPRLGEEVAAIGFPLGLPLSVTRGSVSGLKRSIPIEGVTRRRLVQTDAAVNQGNSGGPLLTVETGEVVGLVDLGTTEANGIAFAVSAEVAGPLFSAWEASPQPVAASECDYYYEEEPPVVDPPASGEPAADVATFDGDYFSIDYPAYWDVETAEASKGEYLDTTIRDPGDEKVMLRVDVTPGLVEDPAANARSLARALSRLPGYEELEFSRRDFGGYDAVWWEFLVEEDGVLVHKVDVFFTSDAGDQVAVLTQAPADVFDQWVDAFDAIRASLYVY